MANLSGTMPIDLKKTVQKLEDHREEPLKGRFSIYVTKEIWESFKTACEPQGASRVLEEWMREALGKLEEGKAKRK